MLKTPDHVAQKWYSDVKAAIDTRPDRVVMIVVQAQRELKALRTRDCTSVEKPHQVPR